MKTIFMGTPEFAIDSLKMLHKKTELKAIFTKIDKVNGRNNKINFSPVKQYALDNNINLYQPKSLRNEEIVNEIRNINPDLIVVVAYGMIIPKEIIDIPKYGIINVHSSLLPKYRGAAPIHAAILNDDKETGVSIMYINEKLDEGDVICVRKTPILESDNLLTLHNRLKELGKEALEESLDLIINPNFKAEKQNHSLATFVKPIKKEETKLDFNEEARKIFNKIRAFNPFPEAYCILNGKVLKLYESEVVEYIGNEENGKILKLNKNGILVKCKNGAILIKELKLEGKKKQKAIDFINGRQIKIEDRLE